MIHLITSQQHYAFNLAWVKTPPPAADPPEPPRGRALPRRSTLAAVEDESLGVRGPSGRRFESEGVDEGPALTATPSGWRLETGADQRFRLRDRRESGFGAVDSSQGFTARIRLRVAQDRVAEEFIFEEAPFRSCHASTLVDTGDGLVAAWFGGSDESNSDVGVWPKAVTR